jgi:hypothetical protein
MNSTDNAIKMPPLARNLIDTDAVAVIRDWINSLPGTAALSPPAITPNGGTFTNSVNVTLSSTNVGASFYYTLDGSLPTTNAFLYSSPIYVTSNVTVRANAIESGFNNSISLSAAFSIFAVPPLRITSFGVNGAILTLKASNGVTNGIFVLLSSTNAALPLAQWTRILTDAFDANGNLNLSTNVISPGDQRRFYRLQLQ